MKDNLFRLPPAPVDHELVEELLHKEGVRIERILSKGQTSPESGWYDQNEHEWVIVLQGSGEITFEDGDRVLLKPGDYIHIQAHRRHRVSWTEPGHVTLWLAVFYQ